MKLIKLVPAIVALAALGSVAGDAEAQGSACLANLPSPTAAQMAAGKPWYINAEPIEVFGAKYTKYGLPRVLAPGEVTHVADYRGVAVAAESSDPSYREVLYVLTAMPCEFQPYELES